MTPDPQNPPGGDAPKPLKRDDLERDLWNLDEDFSPQPHKPKKSTDHAIPEKSGKMRYKKSKDGKPLKKPSAEKSVLEASEIPAAEAHPENAASAEAERSEPVEKITTPPTENLPVVATSEETEQKKAVRVAPRSAPVSASSDVTLGVSSAIRKQKQFRKPQGAEISDSSPALEDWTDPAALEDAPQAALDEAAGEEAPAAEIPTVSEATAIPPEKPSRFSGFSRAEKIGLTMLVLALAVIGFFAWRFSISRLPEAGTGHATEFPVKGKFMTIAHAETFWRAPIVETDRVRRGTVMIPVMKIKISAGKGAVRVNFKNPPGESVGDLITRAAPADGTLEISATAGFSDPAEFNDYRANPEKTWTIDVSEAASLNAEGAAYHKIFSMPVFPQSR